MIVGAPAAGSIHPRVEPERVGPGLWRFVGCAAVLVAAIGIGYRFPVEQQLRALTGLVLVSAAVLFSARQFATPTLGFCVLLLSAVLAPLAIGRGLTACFLIAVFVCAHWVLKLGTLQREWPASSPRVVAATITFVSVAVLAFLTGLYPWFPTEPAPMVAQLGGLALFVLSGFLFLTVGHQIQSVTQLQWLTWIFLVAGALLVCVHLPVSPPGLSRIAGLADPGSVGSLFWVWVVAMSFGQALCNTHLDKRVRILAFVIGSLALARGLLLSFSWASGWLPPLVTLGIILLARFPRFTTLAGALLIAPVLLVSGRVADAVFDNEAYSWMTRLEAWVLILDLVKVNPLLGFGPANYYHYTPLSPILGWWVNFNSHNNYLDLLAQTGALGLVAFLWFAYECGRLTLRVRARAPAGFPRAYAIAALGGLAGSLTAGFLGDWIVPFAYNIGMSGFRSSLLFWFFLGGSLALYRLTAPGRRPEPLHHPLTSV